MYIPTLVVLVFLDFLGTKRNFITFTHTKNKSTYAMHYLPKQLRTLPTSWREYWNSISPRDFCLYTIDNRIFPGKLKMQSLQSRSRICFGFYAAARRQLINTELSRSSVFSLSHLSWTLDVYWKLISWCPSVRGGLVLDKWQSCTAKFYGTRTEILEMDRFCRSFASIGLFISGFHKPKTSLNESLKETSKVSFMKVVLTSTGLWN